MNEVKDDDNYHAPMYNDKGMHPGVINGRRCFEKVNTSKPYKGGKGKLGKKQANLSRRRSAHSETLRTKSSKTPDSAFKTPGSMNRGK